MNANQPIIDVTPLSASSTRQAADSASRTSSGNTYQQPTYYASSRYRSSQSQPFASADSTVGTAGAAGAKTVSSVLGGVVQAVVGCGMVLLGLPMLILPGPGLLFVGFGAMLAAGGMSRIFN